MRDIGGEVDRDIADAEVAEKARRSVVTRDDGVVTVS